MPDGVKHVGLTESRLMVPPVTRLSSIVGYSEYADGGLSLEVHDVVWGA